MRQNRTTPLEKDYRARRDVLLKGVQVENIADDFPMFIRRQNLVRFLSRYELFRLALNVKGSIVECGVYRGASLMLYAQLSSIYEPYAFNREIIGFDTFEGFVGVHKKDKSLAKIGDFSDVDIGILKESVVLYDLNRPLGHIPKIQLIKGDATKTIPDFFRENPYVVVALLHLDFDLYAPTKIALETIVPRMVGGSILVFDEINARQWSGETTALLESLSINKLKIKKFPEDPYLSYAILE